MESRSNTQETVIGEHNSKLFAQSIKIKITLKLNFSCFFLIACFNCFQFYIVF